jgi:hypothetical protein
MVVMSKKKNPNIRPAPRSPRADGWLSPQAAAIKVGVSLNTILYHVRAKGLPLFKVIGDPINSGVIHQEDLKRHFEENPLKWGRTAKK